MHTPFLNHTHHPGTLVAYTPPWCAFDYHLSTLTTPRMSDTYEPEGGNTPPPLTPAAHHAPRCLGAANLFRDPSTHNTPKYQSHHSRAAGLSVLRHSLIAATLCFLCLGPEVHAAASVPVPVSIPMVRIATVNVYEPSITNQAQESMEVTYVAHNREGIQPDIVSSVMLLDASGSFVYHQQAKESFTLGIDEQRTIHDTVQVPPYLKGDYSVFLKLANRSGVDLANVRVGSVHLNGSGEYVAISGCVLKVSNDDKEYDLFQGIDVDQNETLTLSCTAKSSFSSVVTVIPVFTEYWRSPFGPKEGEYSGAPLLLEAGKETPLSIPMRKNTDPQAYTQFLVLRSEPSGQASDQVEIHYVVRGESATIQNIVLDKPSYRKGDVAKVTFGWSGSADSFMNPRHEGALSAVAGVATLDVWDGVTPCSEKWEQRFETGEGKVDYRHEEATVAITRDCFNPKVRIVIANTSGNVLDERTVSAATSTQGAAPEVVSQGDAARFDPKQIALLVIFLLCGGALIVVLVRKRGHNNEATLASLFLLAAVAGTLSPQTARADTFTWSPDGKTYTVTANHNKANYAPGETAVVTTSIAAYTCFNGWNAITGTLSMLAPQSKQINVWNRDDFNGGSSACQFIGYYQGHAHYTCSTGLVNGNFTVSTIPGTYNASYQLSMYYFSGEYKTATGDFMLPYTVSAGSCGTANTSMNSCHTLTVTKAGTVPGSVSSNPSGISSCTTVCTATYAPDTPVTLTASHGSNVVVAWSGCDAPSGDFCTVTMNASRSVTATFTCPAGFAWNGAQNECVPTANARTLTVYKEGTGSGVVSGSNIDCGSTCVAGYPEGEAVTLTSAPSGTSEFVGWSGACTGTQTICSITMDTNKTVTATYTCKPSYSWDPISQQCTTSYCGPATGGVYQTFPADNQLCAPGATPQNKQSSGTTFLWECRGSDNTSSCSATRQRGGAR